MIRFLASKHILKTSTALFFLALTLPAIVTCSPLKTSNRLVLVEKVVDGDTIILSNGSMVRYLGIDTPEVRKRVGGNWVYNPEPFALESTKFDKMLVEGKEVFIEFDKEIYDRFGRLLAYVYINKVMVNETLLRQGFAELFSRNTNLKYYEKLKAAQEDARMHKRGIWRQDEV